MIYTILESIRYTLTLLFGIFVSALFLDIRINKKNVICLFLFFYIDLVLQGIFYFTKDLSAVISLYPFITHLPLLLFFVLIFKKRLFPSLIAITSAYLCCQISNWTTIFVSSFIKNIDNITYSLTLIISFVFIIKFVYLPIKNNHVNLFLLVSFQCSIIYLIIFLPFIQSFFILGIKQL